MESPVESIVKEISKEMSDLLLKRVYVGIMDRIGQIYYADDSLDTHTDFITNFIKNNFNVLDVGDHSIPLSNVNLIFFKTSKNFAVILFTREGRVGQLLAFKRRMEEFGKRIEQALVEFITDIEKIEKIEHDLYGAPPTIPEITPESEIKEESASITLTEPTGDNIEEIIEDYSFDDFEIPEEILEPVEPSAELDVDDLIADLNFNDSAQEIGTPQISQSVQQTPSIPVPVQEELPAEVPIEPSTPQIEVKEPKEEIVATESPAQSVESTKTIRVVPTLTRKLGKKEKFDVNKEVIFTNLFFFLLIFYSFFGTAIES